jgi:MFS transporter, DHA2 family, multidrug resistance protein
MSAGSQMLAGAARLHDEKPSWLRWVIAFTVGLAALMEVIDVSIVNVSLPQMQGNLGATLAEIGWVITGYAVANVIIIPLTAWLGQYFGTKTYYIFSLIAFIVASMMCGMAHTLPEMIAARVLQGLFGGGLLPRAQAILFETFPPHQIGLAQSVFGISVIVGPTFGPTLGGYLTDTLGWRWVFFINLPIGLLALLMSIAFLPPSKPINRSRKIDWWGILLLATWIGAFQTFLEEGEGDGWFESSFITALACIAVVGLGLFIWRELASRSPAVDLRVLRYRSLAAGSLFAIVLGIGLYGTIFVIPIFTQNILGFTAVQTGMLIIPGALISGLLMPFIGRLSDRVDARIPLAAGTIVVGLATIVLSQINIDTSGHTMFWPLLFRGVGMGLMFIPLSITTLGPVPKQDIASAASFFNLTRQLGGSIGIALLATFLAKRETFHYNTLAEHISRLNMTTQQYLGNLQSMLQAKGMDPVTAEQASYGMIMKVTKTQAMILSFEDVLFMVGSLFLASVILVIFLHSGKGQQRGQPGPRLKEPTHDASATPPPGSVANAPVVKNGK